MSRFVPWRAILALGMPLAAGACASTGAVPRPFPVPSSARAGAAERPAGTDAATTSETAPLSGTSGPSDLSGEFRPSSPSGVVTTAMSLRGTPYRNGGSDPTGFDCSGFTQYVFAQHGIALAREVRDQYQQGNSVDVDDLAPGDLLFFSTTAAGPSHVAIAIGGDQFVHAPSSTGVVRVEHLGASYWSARYLGARRID